MTISATKLRGLAQAVRAGLRVEVGSADTLEIMELALATLEHRALLVLSGATDEEIKQQVSRLRRRKA